jgi:hypothetical protein
MLTILSFTRCEPFSEQFLSDFESIALHIGAEFVVAIDGDGDQGRWSADKKIRVKSKGYVESVLDEALAHCSGDYVLRMDDDEVISVAMMNWLLNREYEKKDHWKFATANMWWDKRYFIANPPLWPDHHTRLSVKYKAGGRFTPHAGSPFGGGELAPVIFEHHKFLVKPYEHRQEIAARYDAFCPGYGTGDGLKCFSLPEDCFDTLVLGEVGNGLLSRCDSSPRIEVQLATRA